MQHQVWSRRKPCVGYYKTIISAPCSWLFRAKYLGQTCCTRTVEDGKCGVFDILNAVFFRVLILSVWFGLLAPYPISAKKLAHTPHKLLLCIIRPDIYWEATLMGEVLKDLVNVKAWLESYSIDISEKCLSSNNNFKGGSAIIFAYRREKVIDSIIIMPVRPTV